MTHNGDYLNREQLRGRKHGRTTRHDTELSDYHKKCSLNVPKSSRKDMISICEHIIFQQQKALIPYET